MPWTEVDGSIVHYTPAPGSTATEAEVQDEIRRCMNEAAVEKIARLKHMPTEQDALRTMFAAYQRLKELGWNDAIYCPKDGSSFDVIEPGSTGIHRAHYSGNWPKGSWWVEGAGDLWPSRPILYRVTEAEKAKWTAVRKGLAEAAYPAESGASGTDGQGPLHVHQPSAEGAVSPGPGGGWRSPEAAPTEAPVIVRTQFGRIFKARLTWGFEGDDGPCWGWEVDDGDPHPDCWTDGVCWASNADGEPSDQPVAWMPLPPPAESGASGTASEHDVAYKALGIALAALQHIQGMEPITQEITLPTVMAQHAVDALKEIEALGATSCPNPCGECRGVVRAGKCGVCGWEPVP